MQIYWAIFLALILLALPSGMQLIERGAKNDRHRFHRRPPGWYPSRDTLVPAAAGAGVHDGDLFAAICLDAVHQAARQHARRGAGGVAGNLFAADRITDLFLAVPGLPGGPVRTTQPHCAGRRAERAFLGIGFAGHVAARALSDLRTDRRTGDRHRLY